MSDTKETQKYFTPIVSTDNPPFAAFADVAPFISDRLEVAKSTNPEAGPPAIAFAVRGKKGGKKAAVWLSFEDARALANAVLEAAQ